MHVGVTGCRCDLCPLEVSFSPPRAAGKRRMRAAADGNGVEVSHGAGLGTHAIHAAAGRVGCGGWCCLDAAVVVAVAVGVVSSRYTTW